MSTPTADVIAAATAIVNGALGLAPTEVRRPRAKRASPNLAGRIDHTLLKATATADQVFTLCAEAKRYGFASVCVNTRWVPLAAAQLVDADSMVCTVVSFPLGAMSSAAKAEETRIAVEQGANEVDMVIDIGGLLSGEYQMVLDDMAGVANAAGDVPVKVILETCYLTDEQKAIACLLALRSGVAYVKTSTGFGTGGATPADIALMRATVGDALGVKASGGIHSREDADNVIAAGADRVGASASIAIIGAGPAGGDGY